MKLSLKVLLLAVLVIPALPEGSRAAERSIPPCKISFSPKDVVAFVGGADVAAASDTGHTESLLAALFPGTTFRNFGWEGDTVYAQPRDHGFPPLKEHLKKNGATVVMLQFGRMEAFDGRARLPEFEKTYQMLLDDLKSLGARFILVTPPPFEKMPPPFPDLLSRNEDIQSYCAAIKMLAERNDLAVIDLFNEVINLREKRLTTNGVQFTPAGHATLAIAMARQLGCRNHPTLPAVKDASGAWDQPALEKVRQAVIEKNVLWTYYWRPHNWAFLGGDRTSQPSSRDHRDPTVRWFPAEMEQFIPMIRGKDEEIQKLATPGLQQQP